VLTAINPSFKVVALRDNQPMGFFANFKAKRAAKRANAVYQTELFEWERENQVLAQALDIFTDASSGSQPDDQSLVQKIR
jgi:hypothetical protein